MSPESRPSRSRFDALPWRSFGLAAAVAAFFVPFGFLLYGYDAVRAAFGQNFLDAFTACLCAAVFLGLQASAIVALLKDRPGAARWGVNVAITQWLAALAIGTAGLFVPSGGILDQDWAMGRGFFVFGAWFEAWMRLPLLPLLFLLQWTCLVRSEPDRKPVACWRGIGIASMSLCALLGAWVLKTMLVLPLVLFFGIGTTLHLIAIWQIAVRSRFEWAWSGLVGFGCLISGLVLVNLPPEQPSSGFGPQTPLGLISFVLGFGWFALAPYLPLLAYVLTAVSSVMLLRARRAEGPSRTVEARKSIEQTQTTDPFAPRRPSDNVVASQAL